MKPFFHLSSRRGSALLIVLGMLSFLLISAVAFTIYMRVERVATSNYRHSVVARQMLQIAFADARFSLEERLQSSRSGFWPMLTNSTDAAYADYRILVSSTNSNSAGGAIPLIDGFGDQVRLDGSAVPLLNEEAMAHVPPILASQVLEAGWHVGWRPIEKPTLFDRQDQNYSTRQIAGRYGWMVVNISDMLDINAIGWTNSSRSVRGPGISGGDFDLAGNNGPSERLEVINGNSFLNRTGLQRHFMTGADLSAVKDNGDFKAQSLDWFEASIARSGADPLPLTTYSLFPFVPQLAFTNILTSAGSQRYTFKELSDLVLTCDGDLVRGNGNLESQLDLPLRVLMGKTQTDLNERKAFRLALLDYIDDDSIPYNGAGGQDKYAMAYPCVEAVPMLSQIWCNSSVLAGSAFDASQQFRPTSETAPVVGVNLNPRIAGAAGTYGANLNIQLCNLADKQSPAATVEVTGYYGVSGDGGATYAKTGLLGSANPGSVGALGAGTFFTANAKLQFPPDSGTFPAKVNPGKIYVDFGFHVRVYGGSATYDEMPVSRRGIDAAGMMPPNNLTPSAVEISGEHYIRIRHVYQLVAHYKKDADGNLTILDYYTVEPAPRDAAASPTVATWDAVDPRFNWFSPGCDEKFRNTAAAQAVLNYYGKSGEYQAASSSVHWFYRPNGTTANSAPNPIMQAAMQKTDDMTDTVNLSGIGQYQAFSCGDYGAITLPGELAYLPRPPYYLYSQADFPTDPTSSAWPFFRSIRSYRYGTAVPADTGFLGFFAATKSNRRGLVNPNTTYDSKTDMGANIFSVALQGMPKTIREAISGSGEKLDVSAINALLEQLKNRSRATGDREMYASDRIFEGAINGRSFRELNGIKDLPEVQRKAIAAMSQECFSRNQQLFLFILRADAYTPAIGTDLASGGSSASARAVALVWRDSLRPDVATMNDGPWAGGNTSIFNDGYSTEERVPHKSKLIYFQIIQ